MDEIETIISETIAEAEAADGGDTGADESSAQPAQTETKTDGADSTADTKNDGTDAATEQTEPPAPKKRRGAIPYESHERILANARKEAADAKATELQERYATYDRPETALKLQLFDILERDPQEFAARMAEAAKHDPRFAIFANLLPQTAGQRAASVVDDPSDPEPAPSSPDGYTLDDLKKLNAWNRRQAKRELIAEAQQQRQMAVSAERAALTKAVATLQDAQTWPGFADNQKAIETEMRASGSDLHSAYRKVVLTKYSQDETAMRQRIMAELDAKRGAASVPGASAATSSSSEPSDEDIIRATFRAGA